MKRLLLSLCFPLFCITLLAETLQVSSGVKYELIDTYDVERLNKILTEELAEFTDLTKVSVEFAPAQYDVKLYRVIYPSVVPEQQNKPTIASGLLAIPVTGKTEMPVVSYQHGTVFEKYQVPSDPEQSMETRVMVAQFAGNGYVVVGADYFGLGQSSEPNSYMVKEATQQACLDNLHATREVSQALGVSWGPLFLSGWSQGSWSTLMFLHKLESLGVSVTAAATACAPNDLYALVTRWINHPTDLDASYIPAVVSNKLHSYSAYYNLPDLVKQAIRSEYVETAHDFYTHKITSEEALSKLPEKTQDLLNEDFVKEGFTANASYWQILQRNEAYRWRTVTPLRAYYGQADEVMPPYIVSLAALFQDTIGGAEATAIDAGETANHRGTFLFGVVDQKKWFDELLSSEAQ